MRPFFCVTGACDGSTFTVGFEAAASWIGFAIRYNKTDDIIVCYLGDAATNQGQFFEAMNMVATWELPVLYMEQCFSRFSP